MKLAMDVEVLREVLVPFSPYMKATEGGKWESLLCLRVTESSLYVYAGSMTNFLRIQSDDVEVEEAGTVLCDMRLLSFLRSISGSTVYLSASKSRLTVKDDKGFNSWVARKMVDFPIQAVDQTLDALGEVSAVLSTEQIKQFLGLSVALQADRLGVLIEIENYEWYGKVPATELGGIDKFPLDVTEVQCEYLTSLPVLPDLLRKTIIALGEKSVVLSCTSGSPMINIQNTSRTKQACVLQLRGVA